MKGVRWRVTTADERVERVGCNGEKIRNRGRFVVGEDGAKSHRGKLSRSNYFALDKFFS